MRRALIAAGLIVLAAAGPALAFRNLAVQSTSMMPLLFVGDTVTVAVYGIDYDALAAGKTVTEAATENERFQPRRGDVAAFKVADGTDYVKRIVGMPGERVKMTGGRLFINGVPVKQQPVSPIDGACPEGEVCRFLRETLANGVSYIVLDTKENSLGDDTEEFTIPAGHYFAIGDNRDNSVDSRFVNEPFSRVGFVPRDTLVGRLHGIWPNAAHAPGPQRMAGYPDLR